MNKTSDWRFHVAAQGKDTLEIAIYDVIGKGWDGEGTTANAVLEQLKGSKATTLRVRINSVGGSAFEGLAIYSLLRDHEAKVIVDVDGLAASAASVIAMAGDEIRIADGALMMIHSASTAVWGNADDLQRSADMLRKLDDSIVSIYSARSSKRTREQLAQAMTDETWLNAQEAVEWGLADVVTKAKAVAACGDLSRFRKVPEQLKADMNQDTETQPEAAAEAVEPAPVVAAPVAAVAEAQPDTVALQRIFAATGLASAEDVIGTLVAGRSALDSLPALEARIAEFEQRASAQRRSSAVETAVAEGRVTPAMRETFVPQLAKLSDEEFVAALKALPAVLKRPAATEPAAAQAANALPDGRTYDDLKPAERAELKRTNPDLFNSLRASSKQV